MADARSHSFFRPDEWLEAAKAYLELDRQITGLEARDTTIDHRAGHCHLCAQIDRLLQQQAAISARFASRWAEKTIELAEGEKR